jgi:hypothetical protein
MTAPLQPPAGAGLARRVGTMSVRNGRYFDGDRSYQRTSKLLENIETDTWHLDEWKQNMLAIGLSMRSDLVLGVAAAAQFDPLTGKLTIDAKSALRGLRRQASEAAKSRAGQVQGNALHTATERLDLGESVEQIGLPRPFDADLRAYETLKRAMGLTFRPEHIERTVRNSATASAGTFDRLGECELLVERGMLSPGELLVVDVKTEGDPLKNLIHIGPQLADYAYADDMFVPEPRPVTDDDPHGPFRGRYEPLPNVSRLVGLMIHVRDGRAVPYIVDLTAGWRSAQRAAAQRDELAASKTPLGNPGCWAQLVPIDLPPTPEGVAGVQQFVASVAARGPMGASAPAGMTPAQYVATADTPRAELSAPTAVVTEEAQRGPDGLVRWVAVPDEHPLHTALVEQIDIAPDLPRLAALFELAQQHGVEWSGRVAELAERRRRIIECPQRALHSGAGRCACSWSGETNDLP